MRGVSSVSRFMFLHVNVPLFQHHLLNETILLFAKNLHIYVGLFLGVSLYYPLMGLSFTNGTLEYYSFTVRYYHGSSNFVLVPNILLAVLGFLCLQIVSFRISFQQPKQLADILIGIALNLYDILTILSLPIHEHRVSLHLFNSLNSFNQSFVIFHMILYVFC